MGRLAIVVVTLVLASVSTSSLADDWEDCTVLSFGPLDVNIPACTALLDDEGNLSDDRRALAHGARAAALHWATTYHHGHEVDPEALLLAALDDLDQAVALDPRFHGERAEAQQRLGRHQSAVDDYTAAIEARPDLAVHYLSGRAHALEALGDLDAAIDDMTAAIRLTTAAPDLVRHLMRRGALHEAAGNPSAAAADFRHVLRLAPDHVNAVSALQRLPDER